MPETILRAGAFDVYERTPARMPRIDELGPILLAIISSPWFVFHDMPGHNEGHALMAMAEVAPRAPADA